MHALTLLAKKLGSLLTKWRARTCTSIMHYNDDASLGSGGARNNVKGLVEENFKT
jgi:hypothetical protein